MDPRLGELKKIDVKRVWPHEARNFTPWLAANIGHLGEALGLELEVERTEANVGAYSLDILARDLGTDRYVVIENQYGSTDHDHLGKVLTYAAGFDAGTMIWVVESLRDEHRQALDWLNQRSDTDTHFFAVVLEAWSIDGSNPAPVFRPAVVPNDWQKKSRSRRPSPSGRAELYLAYFQGLIDDLRDNHAFTNAKAAQPQNWYSFSSGTSGIHYGASFAQGSRLRAELYIGTDDAEKNQRIFNALHLEREAIEAELGAQISWEPLDEKKACRIAVYTDGEIEMEPAELAAAHEWHVTWLLKLKRVLGPRIEPSRLNSTSLR